MDYPHRLNLYTIPPLHDVSIEDFETAALDRLRVLVEIESCSARGRSWDDTKAIIKEQCAKYLRLNPISASPAEQDLLRRKDQLSHFVLRLVFCQTPELRQRFTKAEMTLFRMRYEEELNDAKHKFILAQNFDWPSVSSEEKAKLEPKLLGYYNFYRNDAERRSVFEKDYFFKVRWTKVPDLVERRRVHLSKGYAYVSSRDQASLVFQEFQKRLEKALEEKITGKSFARFDEDNRLMPILNNLQKVFQSGGPADWTQARAPLNSGEINADMVDGLAYKHFPLCMRTFYGDLLRNHHLNHFGRLYFGLFLKGLGLELDEALVFWRRSFTGGKVSEKQFESEHKYNIRHSYGQEGSRKAYAPKSCSQLIQAENAGHGCPYAHYTPENLQTTVLDTYGLQGATPSHIPELLALKKSLHPNLCCTRVFEITHGLKKGDGVDTDTSAVSDPNKYAARSIELEKEKIERAKTTVMDVDS